MSQRTAEVTPIHHPPGERELAPTSEPRLVFSPHDCLCFTERMKFLSAVEENCTSIGQGFLPYVRSPTLNCLKIVYVSFLMTFMIAAIATLSASYIRRPSWQNGFIIFVKSSYLVLSIKSEQLVELSFTREVFPPLWRL